MAGEVTRRPPRVLVVDDDRMLVPLLARGLRFEGFDVSCAYGGAEAIDLARDSPPDLVLLDIGMPEKDGLVVLRELRRASDVPVVMLTARDEVADKVGALDSGADDYLAKPFAFDELMARIWAVLRRRDADALDRLCYDDLCCDLGTREVVRAGCRIELRWSIQVGTLSRARATSATGSYRCRTPPGPVRWSRCTPTAGRCFSPPRPWTTGGT